ncbi:MAG: ATP-binding protein [Defluviitaleaceae bacterium]|nr:ATP-binding protein [Defluviitaleaceae bacterium]
MEQKASKAETNRLAKRARVLYFIIPAFMVVVILLVGSSISSDIADDAAHRMARQYSVEAAANFQVYMNPHMRMMQQMAYSVTISRWLANENDVYAKAAAFEEMEILAASWPNAYFMFTVYESLRGYNYSVDLAFEDFHSWGQLQGGYVSQWFYDTRDAEMPYILNIQRNRPDEFGNWELYIWSNHRMYYQGRFVGVFTIGSPFADIYTATFGGFGYENKRGYIIDRDGNVRLDSAGILEVIADGIPSFPAVPESLESFALQQGINLHLQNLEGGMFPLGTPTIEAVRLENGDFRYASISAIVGTDWAVMVLSSRETGFDTRYMPLIVITIIQFVSWAFFGSMLVRRSVLIPLKKLAQSAAGGAAIHEASLYGTDRNDEIGILALSFQNMLRKIKESQEKERLAMAEMKRIEVAEESNKAKSRFLARMSHDIRTPITAVMGISEIELQNSALLPQTSEAFAKIHSSAGILLNIVNDVLDLSKIEAGKMTLLQEEYDTAYMISDIILLHAGYNLSKDIEFRLSVDENLPKFLTGDITRIGQVVGNLLSNAFKYTESGFIRLTWRREAHSPGNDFINLLITLTDTGLGMTSEQINALRNSEYTRFHEQEKREISGTGLGMPIVHNLLNLMGGKMEIKSQPGKGTEVTVLIPQMLTENTETIGSEVAVRLQNFEENTRSASKKFNFVPEAMPNAKVLVVDDVDINLYVVKGLLAFYDIDAETCNSGFEAIEKIKQGNVYDLIFADHMMPGLDGIDTMLTLRGMGYTRPIVALTATNLMGQAEKFISCGFDGFLSKPVQTAQLNTVLHKYVKADRPSSPDINNYQKDEQLLEILRAEFKQTNKNTLAEIRRAIDAGDTETAHFKAHSLKGVVGLIHEHKLLHAAEQIETVLAAGKVPTAKELNDLETEFEIVMEKEK